MANFFSREIFSKSLFNCHNIIRDNDKLSPEAAFDEISKILFIKIRKERDSVKGIYSKRVYDKEKTAYDIANKTLVDYYQHLFNTVKEHYAADGLFEDHERIRIRENSFEQILKELEHYNLSKTSADIKGIAFEEFLGTTFRGELGQFFTPRTVVDFMVTILAPKEDDIICDPCCGSGGFLIKAFQYIRDRVEKNKKLSKNDKLQKIQDAAAHHFFGTDANPRMARTAKMNMIMHGDGHSGIHHHDGLLNFNGIFEDRFDVILTNPPFGSHVSKKLLITEEDRFTDEKMIARYKDEYGERYEVAMQQVSKNIKKPLLSLYHTGGRTGLSEVLFIERCLNLLKPGGRMGIVLPEGVMDGRKLHEVRHYVESRAKILFIVSLPQEVFMKSGASIKPSILFLQKFTIEEQRHYENTLQAVTDELVVKYMEERITLKAAKANAPTKEEKLRYSKQESALKKRIKGETERLLKERLNYSIPVAKVNLAGIGSRGEAIDNELPQLGVDFGKYRTKNHLW